MSNHKTTKADAIDQKELKKLVKVAVENEMSKFTTNDKGWRKVIQTASEHLLEQRRESNAAMSEATVVVLGAIATFHAEINAMPLPRAALPGCPIDVVPVLNHVNDVQTATLHLVNLIQKQIANL